VCVCVFTWGIIPQRDFLHDSKTDREWHFGSEHYILIRPGQLIAKQRRPRHRETTGVWPGRPSEERGRNILFVVPTRWTYMRYVLRDDKVFRLHVSTVFHPLIYYRDFRYDAKHVTCIEGLSSVRSVVHDVGLQRINCFSKTQDCTPEQIYVIVRIVGTQEAEVKVK
jgi:hypothetical protein